MPAQLRRPPEEGLVREQQLQRQPLLMQLLQTLQMQLLMQLLRMQLLPCCTQLGPQSQLPLSL